MQMRSRILQLRNEILHAAARSGADDVRIFGSVARDEDTDSSDVDFLVKLEPNRTLLDLARLEIALEQILGCRVDVMAETELREPVRSTAIREAVRV